MNPSGEFAVLLHGILRSRTDMFPLSRYLERHGYKTANILYPSRTMDLQSLTDHVAQKIHDHPHYSSEKTLHFVTHSMGGLIARYYIARHRPRNLGRVVMLSPPNTGSDLADALNTHKALGPIYRAVFGPASAQLVTAYKHPANVNYLLGIIAGTKSINPLAPLFLPRRAVGDHDGIVPVARTKIDGMADHIVMPVTHTFMMFNPLVMKKVLLFLETGSFSDHTRSKGF